MGAQANVGFSVVRFSDLGIGQDLVQSLWEEGIKEPFEVQIEAIPPAMDGKDICCRAPTGSGKTLAFGIPMVQNLDQPSGETDPRGLIMVPTRELATQVKEELDPLLDGKSLTAAAIYGGANIEEQIKGIKRGVDIIVATPGRMIDLLEREEISLQSLEMVVLDAADRMADMGFLPQVEWILRRVERNHQTLLFSATLDGVVNTLIQRYQNNPIMHEVEAKEITVEEMTHRFLHVHERDKVKVAAAIARPVSRTLIFSNTKAGCDRLVRKLLDEGIRAQAIHGDLRQNIREKALDRFASGKLPVLVATDVAARGIHVDGVEVVIHYDPPSDHKTYLHRSGRTARAGTDGLVVTLSLWDEELVVKRLQKRVGLDIELVEMFSNDPRLADLGGWIP